MDKDGINVMDYRTGWCWTGGSFTVFADGPMVGEVSIS